VSAAQLMLTKGALGHVANERHDPLNRVSAFFRSWIENSIEICRPSL
jgi:hypothetical protein